MTYPVWLNADIVSGPVNQNKTIPVDPKRFLKGSSLFSKAVLSIGWTTEWKGEYNNGSYTAENIQAMLGAITENGVTNTGQSITFPVRAGIAANSEYNLQDLLRKINKTNKSTLTIWSSPNDYVNVGNLRKLIYNFGTDRIYLDVPKELSLQLNLQNNVLKSSSTEYVGTLGVFTLITAAIVIISTLLQKDRM